MITLKRKDIIYSDLSYKVIGILFDVFNQLGYGYQEKYYQKAIAISFSESKIKFKQEVYSPLKFNNQKVGNYYFDFLIEDKIVLEIKRGNHFSRKDIEQIYSYLKVSKLKLGLLVNFTSKGIKFKRILNINS